MENEGKNNNKTTEEKVYEYWICSIKNIGIAKVNKLLNHFGNPENVFNASYGELSGVKKLSAKAIDAIAESRNRFNYEKSMDKLRNLNMKYVTCFDKDYPEKLKNIRNMPVILYYIGGLPKAERSLAIVGARNCSDYGRECARYFGNKVSSLGIDIISGMARGIDGWGHQGALEGNGKTYAVMGCGANICYPKEHVRLYESIIKNGGIISEYPPDTEALPMYFPQRNRIITGLSDGVLVVEAMKRSGSLITSDFAMDEGKDVFVVPGRINDALSAGCNELIKQGAIPVTSVGDIFDRFGFDGKKIEEKISKSKIILERKEKMVYAIVCLEPTHLKIIMDKTSLSLSETMGIIRSLMEKKLIRETGSNYFIRTSPDI